MFLKALEINSVCSCIQLYNGLMLVTFMLQFRKKLSLNHIKWVSPLSPPAVYGRLHPHYQSPVQIFSFFTHTEIYIWNIFVMANLWVTSPIFHCKYNKCLKGHWWSMNTYNNIVSDVKAKEALYFWHSNMLCAVPLYNSVELIRPSKQTPHCKNFQKPCVLWKFRHPRCQEQRDARRNHKADQRQAGN